MIHLDTNLLIEALLPGSRSDKALRRWLLAGETVGMSAVAWAEFLCGPPCPTGDADDNGLQVSLRQQAERLVGQPAAFDGEAATLAAQLFNATGRRRGSLGDCMVAAVAIAGRAGLATLNTKDFASMRALGLRLVPLEEQASG